MITEQAIINIAVFLFVSFLCVCYKYGNSLFLKIDNHRLIRYIILINFRTYVILEDEFMALFE